MVVPVTCECGTRFLAKSTRRKLCDTCRAAKTHHTERPLEFVGVDGEGVTRPDGKHDYVLLSVGDRSLYHPDGSRLTWYDIIPFLWECYLENPDAAYVGFYLGYDFAHWLRDLPENRARILLTNEGIALRRRTKSGGNHRPFPVEHRGFCFDILGMKRFKLWECLAHSTERGHKCTSSGRLYICDTGPFFQTSFLNAVDPEKWPDGAVLSDDEYKLISRGKETRGTEAIAYGTPIDREMIQYNVLENRVLSRLMRKYDEGLRTVGIKLGKDQWFGPGQAAQQWLGGIHAPTRETFEESANFGIRSRLRASYYGGWFEIFAHGHIPGTSWGYDVNSAYPDIQSRLPCVLHGKWEMGGSGNVPDKPYCLVLATLSGSSEYIGSGPHRLRTQNILRPQITRGWYWWPEILASRNAGLIDTIDVEEWISYEPCDCPPPFRGERKLYEDRLRVGKNTMGGKARRLVYNSLYGKTAQSVGSAKFANPFYASLITSTCRTYILNAIATHPHGESDVLMVATDGVVFRHRHPGLHISPTTLGDWTETTHENLTLFMPGIYWDDETRHKLRDGGSPTLKSRGIPGNSLRHRIFDIDDSFANHFSGEGFPTFAIPVGFAITTPKQALARGKWETCGTVNVEGERVINSDPYMKRLPQCSVENGIIRSYTYRTGFGNVTSTPYAKTFGDEELLELLATVTEDGDFEMILAHALKPGE